MGHIDHEVSTDTVGNGAKAREINQPGICAVPRDDYLRRVLLRQPSYLIVIDGLRFPVNAIGNEVIQPARKVDLGPVSQMAAVVKLHAHHGVARLQQRKIHCHIGLGSAVGLHVGVLRSEQLFCAFNSQAFDNVGVLAAAVVTAAWVALRVLVADDTRAGRQHGLAGVVFRGDEYYGFPLSAVFSVESCCNFGIQIG